MSDVNPEAIQPLPIKRNVEHPALPSNRISHLSRVLRTLRSKKPPEKPANILTTAVDTPAHTSNGSGETAEPKINTREEVHASSSPARLRRALELMVKGATGKIDVGGRENLDKIPHGSKIIFVTTHLTDLDLPLAASVLTRDFDIAIAHLSDPKDPTKDINLYIGKKIAGESNFIPISFRRVEGGWRPNEFSRKDFEPMVQSLENGKAIMIAAYSPTKDGYLPNRPGFGAAYLAQLTNASIVPVTVDIEARDKQVGMSGIKGMLSTVLHKPNARMIIGEPIKLGGEVDRSKPVIGQIRDLVAQQSKIMDVLAQPLPPEKRGKWGK